MLMYIFIFLLTTFQFTKFFIEGGFIENATTNTLKMDENLSRMLKYVDDNQEKFIDTLGEAIAIQSVSALPDKRGEVVKMLEWARDRLLSLGAVEAKIVQVGHQILPDGSKLSLPGVLLARVGEDPNKPTLLVYGHLDVQPAELSDGWSSEPFKMFRKDGKLYGRGASDDKGPVIGWLHAIESYRESNVELPINIHFCLEGMEESGSEGLEELLEKLKPDPFLTSVSFVCISDNYWLGTSKPCLTYGLRGITYFFLEVTCAKQDLHSGIFGGSVAEGMADLIHLLDSLIDKNGRILIDGIHNSVAPITDAEKESYKSIDFNVTEYKGIVGADKLVHDDKLNILMSRWRLPSLSLHGIEGAFSESGSKTVIPKTVIGKFSIRIVPNQTPEEIEGLVEKHIQKLWKERGSSNSLKVEMQHGGRPWVSDVTHINFKAAKEATKLVYGVEPDLTREGGSIPVTLSLQESTGKNVMLLPMGAADDGAHSQNEKIDERNYIQGTKLFIAYMYRLASIK